MNYSERVERARERMDELGVDVLLLSVGPDLPYLTGYEAMPLERLTMLVLPRTGDARLVVPRLEAPRVTPRPDLFEIVPWEETDDPDRAGRRARRCAHDPAPRSVTTRGPGSCSTSSARSRTRRSTAPPKSLAPIRMVKDRRRDRRARARLRTRSTRSRVEMRDAPVRGPERARPAPRARRAHARARPRAVELRDRRRGRARREPAPRAVSRPAGRRAGDIVLCDFGGTMRGYCSDITRMFHAGEPPAEVRDAYAVLVEAQEAGVRAATRGHAVLRGRRRLPASHHRGGPRRALRAPRRPRHRPGSARRPLHGRGQRAAARRRATRSASSPASISAGGSGCGSKTSWSRPTSGPLRLNDAPRDLALVG